MTTARTSHLAGRPFPTLPTPAAVLAGRTLAEPRLAPDGSCVVVHVSDGAGPRLVRIDLGDAALTAPGPEVQVTADPPIVGVHPFGGGSWTWLPDGSGIVYACREGLAVVSRDGGVGRLVVAAPEGSSLTSPTVAAHGGAVAFVVEREEGQSVAVAALPDGFIVADAADAADVGGGRDAGDIGGGGDAGGGVADLLVIAEGDPAVFRMDPHWGADGGVVWHEWRAPDMPWTNSTVRRVQVDGNGTADAPFRPTWSETEPDLVGGRPDLVREHAEVVVGNGGLSPAMVGQPQISPDGTRLGLISDGPSGWANVTVDGRPVVGNGVGEEFEHGTPPWGAGQRSWCWSPDGSRVAFVRNEYGFATLCTADVDSGVVRELGRAWHVGLSWTRTAGGAERIAAIRTGGVTPSQLVVYDLDAPVDGSGKARRISVARGPIGGWEQMGLPEPEIVEWFAADGTTLHGRFYPAMPIATQPGEQPGEPPVAQPGVIVSCHGGPTDQNTVTFNPRFAYWMSQGWSVFVPDHRGSTGWGRAFQEAMDGRWGDVDVADVADGVRWLVSTGRVDPSRVVAMGGSAGGFCALHLLVRHPSLFTCGVALYPVTDLAELDATTHRFERFYSATIVGPRSRYASRSPITNAAALRRPLLLMHGDADPVVTVGQSRAYAAAAIAGGADVELVVFEGEGHGWKKPETTMNELHRIDAFLYRHCPST